jgi:hypothetical protein
VLSLARPVLENVAVSRGCLDRTVTHGSSCAEDGAGSRSNA